MDQRIVLIFVAAYRLLRIDVLIAAYDVWCADIGFQAAATAAATKRAIQLNARVTPFPGAVAGSSIQFAARQNTGSYASAEQQHGHVLSGALRTEPAFPKRHRV